MLAIKLPVILLSSTTVAALLLQTAPPLAEIAGPIERLSLVGSQGVAIYFLWRALGRKDEEMAKREAAKDAIIAKKDTEYTALAVKVTETMVQVLDAVKELRISSEKIQRSNEKIGEDLGNAIDDLVSNIGALPCTSQRDIDRAENADHARRIGGKKPGEQTHGR